MTTSTKLFVILVIVMAIFPCIFGGHLVHDFYKCSSDWYRSFFKRCKRNLEYENAGSVTGSNVFMLMVSAALYYMLQTREMCTKTIHIKVLNIDLILLQYNVKRLPPYRFYNLQCQRKMEINCFNSNSYGFIMYQKNYFILFLFTNSEK